jgi:NAD(P)-dependent dehydrogenase (short-subunit alcohol dehydrogenase family)
MSAAFAGKVVLVSGAARGFGRLAAERFAQVGARLVVTDIQAEGLAETLSALHANGAEAVGQAGDIGGEATAPALVELARQSFGRLDIAVNNAGVAHGKLRLADIDTPTMERMLRINLMGTFFAMRAEIPAMLEAGGGAIVNIASVAGLGGAPTLAAYAASKHAVIGLTRSAAVEYARKGLRINAIGPSFADTHMVADTVLGPSADPAAAKARLTSAIPMGRLAAPAEVVQAILFAASPENSFMTGQALVVDGGLTAM